MSSSSSATLLSVQNNNNKTKKMLFRLSLYLLFSLLIVRVDCNESASYLNGIKDAVYGLKSFLNMGLDGLAKLAKTIAVVEQFVDATIDEECEPFICPKGTYLIGTW